MLYSVDMSVMTGEGEVSANDVKPVDLASLFDSKNQNAYMCLESAGSKFYFIAAKLQSTKPKQISKLSTQNSSIARLTVMTPVTSLRHHNCPTGRSRDRANDLKVNSLRRIRFDSVEPVSKIYSPVVGKDTDRTSVATPNRARSKRIAHLKKLTINNSELVNIYKPSRGELSRAQPAQHVHYE